MTQAAPLQTSNAKPKQSDSTGLLLQRKCDCGSNASALTGECEECGEKSMLGLQTKLAISEPGDRYEQEADRVADQVMRMTGPAPEVSMTRTQIARRMPGQAPKPKTEKQKYKEAAKKLGEALGEALMATQLGREIKQKAEEYTDAFISTLPGKVVTVAGIAGPLAGLAATHKGLPIGIPEISLDRWIKPGPMGLKMPKIKITYEGPVDKPTKVMATFSFRFGGSGESKREREPTPTESEKRRAKTASKALEQRKLLNSLKTPEEKEREQRMLDALIASRMGRPKPSLSFDVALPPASPSAQVKKPTSSLSFGVAGQQFDIERPSPLQTDEPKMGRGPYTPPDFKLTGETETKEEEPKKKEEGEVMRKAVGNGEIASTPPSIHDALQSPARPLDASAQSFMESRFGFDFSRVRIHTDAKAVESARAIQAQAYSVGGDVVFGSGQYSPSTIEGRKLLAHELTHVVQQSGEAYGKKRMLGLQTKLAISDPGDHYEQEADRIADEVMRMPVPMLQRQIAHEEEEEDQETLQRKPVSARITPIVQRQSIAEEEDEEEMLQAKGTAAQVPDVRQEIEDVIKTVRQGGGRPLDPVTRAFMEPRFGHDFGQVRVHTGHLAAAAARSVNARAFTVGGDIFFGSGQYDPQSAPGRRLLGHELTHPVQQAKGGAATNQERVAFRAEKTKGARSKDDIGFELFITASEEAEGKKREYSSVVREGVVDLTIAPLVVGDVLLVRATDILGNELPGGGEWILPLGGELEEVIRLAGGGIQLRVIGNLRVDETQREVEAGFTPSPGGKEIRLRFQINALPEQPAINPELARNEQERSELQEERARKRREFRQAKSAAREQFRSLSRPERKEQRGQFRGLRRGRRAARRDKRRSLRNEARELRKKRRQLQRGESCDLETQKIVNQALGLAVDKVETAITKLQNNGLQNQIVQKALLQFMRWSPDPSEPSMDKERMARIIDTLNVAKIACCSRRTRQFNAPVLEILIVKKRRARMSRPTYAVGPLPSAPLG